MFPAVVSTALEDDFAIARALPIADYSFTCLSAIFVTDARAVACSTRRMELETAVASQSRIEARINLPSTTLISSVNLHHRGYALVATRSNLVLVEDQFVDLLLSLPVRSKPL